MLSDEIKNKMVNCIFFKNKGKSVFHTPYNKFQDLHFYEKIYQTWLTNILKNDKFTLYY